MRKTALLTGVAGLVLLTAPAAFAQDPATQTPPASPPAAEAQPQSLSLTPGASVRGSDGQELGKLEGARQTATGQELTVRGADGQLRGVPVSGLTQEGDAVVAAWSTQQYQAAPAITDAPSAPGTPSTTDPSAQPQPTDPAVPPTGEQPTTPDEEPSTEPTTPPPGA